MRRALVLLWLLCGLAPSWACGPLRLAYHPHPGLFERLPDGEMRGMDVEVAREIGRRTGCSFTPVPESSARAWGQLLEGHIDIMPAALYLPERETEVDYLVLLRTRQMLLVRRSAVPATRKGFEDEPPLLVGSVKGARYPAALQAWLDGMKDKGRLAAAGDTPALLRAFEGGRVDGAVLYPLALTGRSAEWMSRHQLMDWWPEHSSAGGWAVSRRTVPAEQRARIRQAALEMLRDGTLQRLARQYLGDALSAHYHYLDAKQQP